MNIASRSALEGHAFEVSAYPGAIVDDPAHYRDHINCRLIQKNCIAVTALHRMDRKKPGPCAMRQHPPRGYLHIHRGMFFNRGAKYLKPASIFSLVSTLEKMGLLTF